MVLICLTGVLTLVLPCKTLLSIGVSLPPLAPRTHLWPNYNFPMQLNPVFVPSYPATLNSRITLLNDTTLRLALGPYFNNVRKPSMVLGRQLSLWQFEEILLSPGLRYLKGKIGKFRWLLLCPSNPFPLLGPNNKGRRVNIGTALV